MTEKPTPLLHVAGLAIAVGIPDGAASGSVCGVTVADDVSFDLEAGEGLGLVGESGCGKSLTAAAILGLLPPGVRVTRGTIRLRGLELLALSQSELRRLRGARIGMVYQEPGAALDPLVPVGAQIAETLEVHRGWSRERGLAEARDLLERVGVPDPQLRLASLPWQLSGGLQQRACIAAALACRPELLIADEPTSSLDCGARSRLLELLADLRREFRMGLLLISHDLDVVVRACDHVAIQYAGRVVERGPIESVLSAPIHPYARALADVGAALTRPLPRGSRFPAIPGQVPDPARWPDGCRFRPRCKHAVQECARSTPPLVAIGGGRFAACPVVAMPGEVRA